MNLDKKVIEWILKLAVGSLASVMVAVVIVLLIGLFMPNDVVDNKDIFPIIGPAFNTVIGAFVGLLGGLSMGGSSDKDKDDGDDDNKDGE
jgi:fumarate reductase subunit D